MWPSFDFDLTLTLTLMLMLTLKFILALTLTQVLGRSLPILAWLSFELGAAGALYLAALSLASLIRSLAPLARRLVAASIAPSAAQSHAHCAAAAAPKPAAVCCGSPSNTRWGSWAVEAPRHSRRHAIALHAAALAIASSELYLNDLPVLWQHMPLMLLIGCAFSLNVLAWHAHLGRFTYLFADVPRASPLALLLVCTLTPLALSLAFAALASLSAYARVRGA